KEIKTAAEELFSELSASTLFDNTLIISPPGHGKTTILRDLVRRISDKGVRISLVDERGEIAAKHGGVAQFDVGRCTDVLDGAPKAQGAMLLLRTMSPQVIALDEITAREDVDAIFSITNCGVRILATAHGDDEKSLFRRPLYRELLNAEIFGNIVILKKEEGNFSYRLLSAKEVEI
ncbi:MAG: stage III sporulation protein AA, partial [Oscillospiraceae bacterium]|nr:stage III sporulation protein AA [Oscillospiraceae bacterium]